MQIAMCSGDDGTAMERGREIKGRGTGGRGDGDGRERGGVHLQIHIITGKSLYDALTSHTLN